MVKKELNWEPGIQLGEELIKAIEYFAVTIYKQEWIKINWHLPGKLQQIPLEWRGLNNFSNYFCLNIKNTAYINLPLKEEGIIYNFFIPILEK